MNKEILKLFNIEGKILLKVKAGAKANTIGDFLEIDEKQYLKISIKAQAEKGKANEMIIKFLAKEFGVPQNKLEISSGKTNQYKTLRILD